MADLRHIGEARQMAQPKSLHIDAMFDRASSSTWKKYASGPSPALRPPSPTGITAQYVTEDTILPLPLAGQHRASGASPLAKLFEYLDLVPLVLQWFERPSELAVLCRVSQEFRRIAERKLYNRIWIRPWERAHETKFYLLLRTLSNSNRLCHVVRHLDIRAFPLSAKGSDRSDLEERCLESLSKMDSLHSLAWTRDKSLTPELVQQISRHKRLRSLEIAGHAEHSYDPALIGHMDSLEELRVMMPDALWRHTLPEVAKRLADRDCGGLRALALICRFSPLIDDSILKTIAVHLKSLRALTLWGTTRVTRRGVVAVLQEVTGLEELSIDVLPHSNLRDLSACPGLSSLRSLSLSLSEPLTQPSVVNPDDLPMLPDLPHLASLSLSRSGANAALSPDGLSHLFAQVDFAQLTQLSILKMTLVAPQVSTILRAARKLDELYISIADKSAMFQCEHLLGGTSKLRVLHILAPERSYLFAEDLTLLARHLPLVEEIGYGNRVYQIVRRGGDIELARWNRTYTPRYFQVWRG